MFDWPGIKSAIERGLTPTQIAETIPNTPSRQAIEKRVKKEGWVVARLPDNLPVQPQDERAIVLSRLRNGSTLELAAAASGVSDRTLRRWREEDSEFEIACRSARAAFISSKVNQINDAPDWKAAAYLLERAPETKDQYGTKQGEQPLIVLNIQRDQVTANGKVIEHGES